MNNDIDTTKIEKLKELFEDVFPQQLELFLNNTNKYIGELTTAIKKNNRKGADDAVHKITSSAALYGAMALSSLAKELEHSDNITFSSEGMNILMKMQEEFEKYKKFVAAL